MFRNNKPDKILKTRSHTRITLNLPVAFLLILSDDIVYYFVVCNNYSVHMTTSHYKQIVFVVLEAGKKSCTLFMLCSYIQYIFSHKRNSKVQTNW